MGWLDGLPTYAQVNAKRRAEPKGSMTPNVVSKQDRRDAKKQNAETFRKAVWARDKGKCRATGVKLSHSGSDPHTVGEVDHAIPRSLAPERIYDTTNGILISKYLNRLRKAVCPEAPEHHLFSYTGPDDRGELQTFTWRNRDGSVQKTRVG
jgi:5-methylcytosine-specific restriction endonuclease McrA